MLQRFAWFDVTALVFRKVAVCVVDSFDFRDEVVIKKKHGGDAELCYRRRRDHHIWREGEGQRSFATPFWDILLRISLKKIIFLNIRLKPLHSASPPPVLSFSLRSCREMILPATKKELTYIIFIIHILFCKFSYHYTI